MGFLFVLLTILLVGGIVAIAVWLWIFVDVFAPISELIRIRLEEQIAVWKIESIGRIARNEQERIYDDHAS
ncbi:MAG: hypothetical protein M9953_11035 [Thermomicrobiales bacterium]|nr:hypothetical protein [Thermomicrobiales bacterium]MCO5219173.1 hypothetical protein [Thermomicrobiales bacterium]MCO5225861.1 hypothetical protein [Thermomicrobiales bacterium]MCO5228069.1 hypothetical protein [Thermomicrobiales bacterium]